MNAYYCQSITYDAQGNPTSYLGHTLTWEKGRQLKSFDNNTYTYNANGIRTSKTVNGVEHIYTLDGNKVLKECWNYNETTKTYNDILIPLCDDEDSVCGIIYNDTPYYFQKNLQGDIISIATVVDGEDGYKKVDVVARYTYDAWGKIVSIKDGNNADISSDATHIANINPFRYRGYYYDAEIGMYYLQSRYYNPIVGRFVNADDVEFATIPEQILLANLFAYCGNDCINVSDPTGKAPFKAIGLQLCLSIGKFIAGFEILWDTSKWKPYLFFFIGGLSKNFFGKTESVLKRATRDNLIYSLKKFQKSV